MIRLARLRELQRQCAAGYPVAYIGGVKKDELRWLVEKAIRRRRGKPLSTWHGPAPASRICRLCDKEKPLDLFAVKAECRYGRGWTCKTCRSEQRRAHRGVFGRKATAVRKLGIGGKP